MEDFVTQLNGYGMETSGPQYVVDRHIVGRMPRTGGDDSRALPGDAPDIRAFYKRTTRLLAGAVADAAA